MRSAIFLDRDGVLNRLMTEQGPRETPVVADELELLPGVKPALARLKRAGYLLVVVTNQPNVAKGKCSWKKYLEINRRLVELLAPEVALDGIYSCLHHPDPSQVIVKSLLRECNCRKPGWGLIYRAVDELEIRLNSSWLVGDSETDVQAGLSAGIPPSHLILVGESSKVTAVTAASLEKATEHILEEGKEEI